MKLEFCIMCTTMLHGLLFPYTYEAKNGSEFPNKVQEIFSILVAGSFASR